MAAPQATPWFFYSSETQIDDPLEFLPTAPATAAAASTTNNPNNPTSAEDDAAKLKRALQKLDDHDKKLNHENCNSNNTAPLVPVVFATVSIPGTIMPTGTNWTAFNPSDVAKLEQRYHSEDPTHEADILVGHNRVYEVSFSEQVIKPVYWRSMHDTAHIKRSSAWYFSSTLTPLDQSLEDAVEKACDQIKPWTEEYLEELNSALLDPEKLNKIKIGIEFTINSPTGQAVSYKANLVFPPCSSEPVNEQNPEAEVKRSKFPLAYIFASYLSTSTMNPIPFLTFPSTKQLVTALLSGSVPLGVTQTLQRHFDWAQWKKIRSLPDRPTDTIGYTPPKVTQVVFVIHGIGQKLSERVESFSFTYAINGFNMALTELLSTENVQQYVEADTNVLVLPVNWRRTLNFEILKQAVKGGENAGDGSRPYTLEEITMKSIPSVRGIISDVILDIPYYMSHHKSSMVTAVVTEANRIYQLFMRHNPLFEGRIHLIGHSLGSALALDILSHQPTDVSDKDIDPTVNLMFNTHNLFLAGSPVGFFLLLQNAKLTPRSDRDNNDNHCGGQCGTYGCVAAKSVYNILHHSDPIAYYLNPTVDPDYAALIDTATLPSSKAFPIVEKKPAGSVGPGSGLFNIWKTKMFGEAVATGQEEKTAIDESLLIEQKEDVVNSDAPAPTEDSGVLILAKNDTSRIGQVVPRQDKLDVEKESGNMGLEKAERLMYELNSNGQIDYVVPLQVYGPLENNQYFSMLTAHSGYWETKDFARLVAIECGRQEGSKYALSQYAAVKKK